MKKTSQLVLLFVVLSVSGEAQDMASGPPPSGRQELLMREFVIHQLEKQHGRPETEAAERREEKNREHQFLEKANTFVHMWTAFAKEYNERKTFNANVAAKLTRAFHELETSESWPRPMGSKTSVSPAK